MKKTNEEITAEVEINFPDGKRTIEMIMKQPYEIDDCQEGLVVVLNLRNGDIYTGLYEGIDEDDDIMLGALGSKNTIGIKRRAIENYLEQTTL